MDTSMFNLEKFLAYCRTYGAVIGEGKGEFTIGGKKMSVDDIFADDYFSQETKFSVDLSESSCEIAGLTTNSYGDNSSVSVLVLAA